MRARLLLAATAFALVVPAAGHAADMSGYYPAGPSCAGLQPIDVYVPPQVAYIVACTVPLPPRVVQHTPPSKHSHWAKLGHWGKHGHGAGNDVVVVSPPEGFYGPHATHDPVRYEGKLVYLKEWSADRPPVHFLVVPN